uniref:Complement C3/4/5 macroglobulin domain-containing protein n=1 Tax=Meleagris gallopavo TaxID=9103 RepID=A0A803Y9I8_MELGA
MRAPALLLALTLFLVIDEASLELQYMVIFPAVIHHFQEEKLCIHFSSVTEDVHLAVTLEVETWSQTVVEKDSEEVFFLHVLIHSSDNVLFEGYKKVLVMPQKSIILIQTDKAFYKPGETGEE